MLQAKDENHKNHTIKDDPNDTNGEGRMYEKIGNLMCPLASFMKYLSKLNPENNAFWQQPSDSYTDTSNGWYTRTLSSMLTKISELSKLSMVYTNHSIRATTITEMDEGVLLQHILCVSRNTKVRNL